MDILGWFLLKENVPSLKLEQVFTVNLSVSQK